MSETSSPRISGKQVPALGYVYPERTPFALIFLLRSYDAEACMRDPTLHDTRRPRTSLAWSWKQQEEKSSRLVVAFTGGGGLLRPQEKRCQGMGAPEVNLMKITTAGCSGRLFRSFQVASRTANGNEMPRPASLGTKTLGVGRIILPRIRDRQGSRLYDFVVLPPPQGRHIMAPTRLINRSPAAGVPARFLPSPWVWGRAARAGIVAYGETCRICPSSTADHGGISGDERPLCRSSRGVSPRGNESFPSQKHVPFWRHLLIQVPPFLSQG